MIELNGQTQLNKQEGQARKGKATKDGTQKRT